MKSRRFLKVSLISLLVFIATGILYKREFTKYLSTDIPDEELHKTKDGHPILYTSEGTTKAEVIYSEPSLYGDIVVFDFEGTRCFLIDSANESCWTFSSNSPSEYVADANYLLENSNTSGKDVLVIGVGAGTLLKTLDGKGYKVDAVEINPKMPEVAEKYFGIPENLDYRLIIDDGRHFLENTDKKYDAIVLDICYVNKFNAHLWTKEFYSLARNRLKDEKGIVIASLGVVNNESNITLENKIANAMRESFTEVYVMDRGKRYQGQFDMEVFLATNSKTFKYPTRHVQPVRWNFDTAYTPSSDENLDEFVKLFLPATEAIISQSKANFGDKLFLPVK